MYVGLGLHKIKRYWEVMTKIKISELYREKRLEEIEKKWKRYIESYKEMGLGWDFSEHDWIISELRAAWKREEIMREVLGFYSQGHWELLESEPTLGIRAAAALEKCEETK